jgi:DNA-binding response OmpR family regulator
MQAAPANILVVEPEGRVANAVASRLQPDGHRVGWVRTLREARGRLRDQPTDVLLLDLAQEAGTLEFFQAVRFAPEAPRGGIVVIADPEDQRSRELAQQLGAAAVVTRPLHADEVSAVVRDLVSHLA